MTANELISQEQTIGYWMLLLLGSALITAVITVFTFGIKVPAGLFVPSMAMGALIGRALGILADHWVEQHHSVGFIASSCYTGKVCVTPGLYAVVGAAAFLGGVTRMTVSLVVIIFELTGGLVYIIPVMVAVLVSKWVGDATGTEGIYDEHIRLRGYPYLDAKTSYTKSRKAAVVMRPRQGDPPLCVLTVQGNTLQSLCSLLEDTAYKGFPVIGNTETRNVVGYVHRNELQACLDMVSSTGLPGDTRCFFTAAPASRSVGFVDLRRCVDLAPLSVTVETPIEIVVDLFRKLGLRYLLVTSGGELVGLITKKDVLEHLESVNHHS